MTARALVAAAVLLSAAPAWAVFACGGQTDVCQCGAANPYPCCDNGGNCTWWAWEAACCNWGVALPSWGNANQWVGNANANPNYSVLGAPVTGAVSCRTAGAYGHVAYVTGVNGGNVSVTEENCWGNYGMRAANYSAGFFQGYITRKGQTECSPGDSQTQGCGACGSQSRGCGTNGKWGGWGACGGQGACMPGAIESEACGQCGTHQRTCGGSCQWGAFDQACSGADPDGGTVACDTGVPGACAAGTLRCVDGGFACPVVVTPTPETCDFTDNDCNGEIDDGLECKPFDPQNPQTPPDSTGLSSGAGGLDGATGTCGSSGSSSTGGTLALFSLSMSLWWLAGRRRLLRPR